jgi:hypothetical protein
MQKRTPFPTKTQTTPSKKGGRTNTLEKHASGKKKPENSPNTAQIYAKTHTIPYRAKHPFLTPKPTRYPK